MLAPLLGLLFHDLGGRTMLLHNPVTRFHGDYSFDVLNDVGLVGEDGERQRIVAHLLVLIERDRDVFDAAFVDALTEKRFMGHRSVSFAQERR
jgi:hypothetical protein